MRSGKELDEAVAWFNSNIGDLYGINVNPSQHPWTQSPKAYGHVYIDDAAFGCPLKYDTEIAERPFVDWDKMLTMGILDM